MFRRTNFFALALLAPLLSACPTTQCIQSSDIQVNIVPDAQIDTAQIALLHVALSVNGSQPKSRIITPTQHIGSGGSAFILRPDSTPPKATYVITVTIEAMGFANELLAIGSDSEQVLSKGCNILTVHLTALPVGGGGTGGDMSVPFGADLASSDLAGGGGTGGGGGGPADMAGCVGGMPDEDNDGRANVCDLCPADYDPTPSDSDGDGLPDACDPDPAKAGNRLVYFDPFDTASGHWMGNFTVPAGMSFLQIDSNNVGQLNMPISVANSVDMVPLNVRAQTFVLAPGYYSSTGPALAIAALFLGDGPDPFQPGTNGVLCQIRFDQSNGDAIRIRPVVNGSLGTGNSTPTPATTNCNVTPSPCFQFATDTLYRLRLTQKGNTYACEVNDSGTLFSPAPLTMTPPVGPKQIITLQETNLRAQFHSVVAETVLP